MDFDLYLYNTEMPETVGMGKELISAPRLDNLTSVQALLDGIITGEREDGINLIAYLTMKRSEAERNRVQARCCFVMS